MAKRPGLEKVFNFVKGLILVMSKIFRSRNLFLLVLVLALFSFVAGSVQSPEQRVLTACNTLESVQNGSEDVILNNSQGVELNGTDVETVNCSNIEAYTFNEPGQGHTDYLSPLYLVIGVLVPVSLVVSIALGLWRAGYFEPLEIGKIFGTSVGILVLSISGLVSVAENFTSDLGIPLVILLMFGGPFLPAIVTYYRHKRKGIERRKLGALTAFVFTSMIYWSLIAYYMTEVTIIA